MANTVVQRVDSMRFIGTGSSGHAVLMDTVEKVGGHDSAAAPLDVMLCSLGGCTGMDVVSILGKMRTPVEDLRIEIDHEREEERPRALTKLHLRYVVHGRVPEENAKKAIAMSLEKYCPVANSLNADIDWELVVNEE